MRHLTLKAMAIAAMVAVPLIVTGQGRRAGGGEAPAGAVNTAAVPRDSAGNVIFRREVFSYPSTARRDPFSSLIASGDIRPMVADLQVVAITLAQSDRNSIATLKDVSTNEIYRVRVGSVFGRLRVVSIRQREVVVAIDEFGNTRQETLSINVSVGGGRTR